MRSAAGTATESETATPAPPSEVGRPSLAERLHLERRGLWLQVLAIVPVLAILDLVRSSSQLQWFDYWTILPKLLTADGSLVPRNLLHFEESHVLGVPSLLYWLNLQVTGGLNRPLAYLVVALVVGQLLILRSLLPRPERLGHWMFGALVVAFSALLFAPQGAWNFSRAMSGTAWLTANLLALAAVACASRRWIVPAIALAGLASITYGTGLVAWPAVILVLLLQGRWERRNWLVVGAAALTAIVYLSAYDPSRTTASSGVAPNEILRRAFQVIGSGLSPSPDVALLLGAGCIVALGYLGFRGASNRELRAATAPWVGIAAFAFVSALLIGMSRGGLHGDEIAVTSRYASLASLAWIALLALLVLTVRGHPRTWLAVAGVALLAFVAGQPTLAGMKDAALDQDELAIAMRLDVSTGYTFGPQERFLPVLEEVGQYPYNSDFDADCGRLGDVIDRSDIRAPTGVTGGNLDLFQPPLNPASVRMSGWFGSQDGDVDCILITDGSLRVIGAGVHGHERPDLVATSPTGALDLGFVAVAPAEASSYRAFAVLDGQDGVYEVRGSLEPAPAEERPRPRRRRP